MHYSGGDWFDRVIKLQIRLFLSSLATTAPNRTRLSHQANPPSNTWVDWLSLGLLEELHPRLLQTQVYRWRLAHLRAGQTGLFRPCRCHNLGI
jgi:hypothetical protein